MKFRPLHDRVVVKRIDAEEKTAGGIIIPDTAKEKPSQGEVIAVGPGGRDENGMKICNSARLCSWAARSAPYAENEIHFLFAAPKLSAPRNDDNLFTFGVIPSHPIP